MGITVLLMLLIIPIAIFVGGLPAIFIIFVILFLIFLQGRKMQMSYKRADIIGKLISAKKYSEAIAIGESTTYRTEIEKMNLLAAYFHAGEKEKAILLATSLKTSIFMPSQANKAIRDWKKKIETK